MKRSYFCVVLLCLLLLCGCNTAAEPREPAVSVYLETAPPFETRAETLPSEQTLPPTETPEPDTPVTEPLPVSKPEDIAFVPVDVYIPDILVELRYAGENNFTGKCIYDFEHAFLRYGTVKKLAYAQQRLQELGYGLKIWDAFRPVRAQFTLWEVYPDPNYVANPNTGYSAHSRGNTLDVTLVDAWGREVSMPTGFDDFSTLADRNYADCPEELAANAMLLQSIMEEAGFTGYYGEWWHFSDTAVYDVENIFTPVTLVEYYALCNEFITLRMLPDVTAEELLKIPANDSFLVLAEYNEFYYVNYRGVYGYVLSAYTAPVEN